MRNLIQNNFAVKILSLVLATLLWFAIESSLHRETRLTATPFSQEVTLDLSCPVAALVPATVERHLSITPSEVQIKLAGSPETLGGVDVTNLAVFVRVPPDLKSDAAMKVEVQLPPAVRLRSVNPPWVSVKPKAMTN